MISFAYEQPFWENGYTVIGIDEVGRGCLAGPVTVGAVVLQPLDILAQHHILTLGINDSKKISAPKREQLIPTIKSFAFAYKTSSSSVQTINAKGIMVALTEAIKTVVDSCITTCSHDNIAILIDGNIFPDLPLKPSIERRTIIKGDALSITIASASILAKVERDRYMKTLSKEYPEYHWDQNKGYGTLNHRNSIKKNGLTKYHRTLFVRNIVEL